MTQHLKNGTRLAAVDLGSNSFRLEIGWLEQGLVHRSEYFKETVRQGNGLNEAGQLSSDAMQRGWECLARFGERLAGFAPQQVRAVATQTLREARNREVFLRRAEALLGFPIDVIAGREEARLIYEGVARLLPESNERRLVIDIGGRSTEMILGQGLKAQVMESWGLGSVAWSMRFFADGQLDAAAFNRADIAAKAILEEALQDFGRDKWDTAYGASGTVGAVCDALTAAGWPSGDVTREGLDWLLERLLKAGSVERLKIEGMKEDRKAVVGGGLAILRAAFDLLEIDTLHAAQGALRHGALYDLLDRQDMATDLRTGTVARLTGKFGVDTAQAGRVSRIARQLLAMSSADSGGGSGQLEEERIARKLDWAAQLHEIGLHISHHDHHKHGAYILDNADAPGFAMHELHRLSLLVLGHRGKLKKLEAELGDADFARQLLTLRLAVIFCHARRVPELKSFSLKSLGPGFVLACSDAGWASAFPQSAHLLREEALAWQKTPRPLTLLRL
ncbi:MAG: Ppx/GppA phosphatase family protein [Pseudomonadota bacterium]